MKKSELILKLQKEVDALGDDYLMSYKIVDSGGGYAYYLLSPDRKGKGGRRLAMTRREFRDYVLDERFKEMKK